MEKEASLEEMLEKLHEAVENVLAMIRGLIDKVKDKLDDLLHKINLELRSDLASDELDATFSLKEKIKTIVFKVLAKIIEWLKMHLDVTYTRWFKPLADICKGRIRIWVKDHLGFLLNAIKEIIAALKDFIGKKLPEEI
jgi:phage-related protein